MNILILVDTFMPSKSSAAVMMYDLAKEFVEKNNKVWVVTYINEENIKDNEKIIYEKYEGINVLRIVSPNKKNISLVKRAIVEITLAYKLNTLTQRYFKNENIDLIVEYSPNIMISKFMKKMKKMKKCKSYLVLRDIFPAWARDLGVIRNPLVYQYFRKIEKDMYKKSDMIGVQSKKNKEYLLENNNLNKDKVEVLYNWVTKKGHKSKFVDYREKWNLHSKTILLYGGNIGKAQQVEFLLELAKKVQHVKQCVFLIVGDGVEKEKLLEKYNFLDNVIFKDSIEPQEYDNLVSQCDIGLVNLNKDFKTHNIPGKLLTYWNNKIPVLAAVNSGNDIIDIINHNNGGVCVETGDMEKYIEGFELLCNCEDNRKIMGDNGYEFSEDYFNVKLAANQILKLVNKE